LDTQTLVIYCITDDILKAMNHQQNSQQKMTDAQVITTAIVAMRFFSGNFEKARLLLHSPRYIPHMLSRSRFNRRLHALERWILPIFHLCSTGFKSLNENSTYIIDSFPVAVCDNIRISRCKIYQEEKYRGYTASKRRYFYGLKIHLLVTAKGEPVEFFLTPGAVNDVRGLDVFDFDLPAGSEVFADKGYNDYDFEEVLKEATGIELKPYRKKNAKRQFSGCMQYVQQKGRKMVETSGSLINQMLPKSIHAVTAKGFELKVALFVLAFSFGCVL